MANDRDKITEYNDWEELLKQSLDPIEDMEIDN